MMEELGPFQEFPNIGFGYEMLFKFLSMEDLLNCRLVCSEWYRHIAKIFKHPNCLSIGENRTNKNGGRSKISKKRTKLKKYLSMKCFEDPLSPIEVLNIQSLNLRKWKRCFQKSNEFQGTMKNITELTLKNIYFQSCEVLIEFLNNFVKLNRLAVHHCSFDSVVKYDWVKLKLERNNLEHQSGIDKSSNILSHLKILDIEMKQTSWSMLLALDLLCCKLEKQSLQDFKLTVLPNEKRNKLRLGPVESTFDNISCVISDLLTKMIKNHVKTLKCLNSNWKIPHCNWNWEVWSRIHFFSKFRNNADFDALTLRNLKIDLGTIVSSAAPLTNDTILIKRSVLMFLTTEIERGLREINLGMQTLDPVLSLNTISSVLSALMTFKPFPYDLRIEYDQRLITDGTRCSVKEFPNRLDLSHDREKQIIHRTCFFMKKYEVKISNTARANAPIVENFKEYLWDYDLHVGSNWKLLSGYNDFINLTELLITCEMEGLKSYSISTICFLCPNLTKLKIVDGPEFKYHSNKSYVELQYEEMSEAVINDYDLKFIFSSLGHLKELVIWANMSHVTNRAFIAYHSQEHGDVDRLYFTGHESYTEFEYLANLYHRYSNKTLDIASVDNVVTDSEILKDKKKDLQSACIANLQALTRLSLRGVGEQISDEILYSKSGLSSLRKLKYLEILGDHKISEEGTKLVQHVKEVCLK